MSLGVMNKAKCSLQDCNVILDARLEKTQKGVQEGDEAERKEVTAGVSGNSSTFVLEKKNLEECGLPKGSVKDKKDLFERCGLARNE